MHGGVHLARHRQGLLSARGAPEVDAAGGDDNAEHVAVTVTVGGVAKGLEHAWWQRRRKL
jgi:hypothetical protein